MKSSARLALLLVLVTAAPLAAQDLTLTNARIVVGNGTVIERGSIVVRGGKIVSVSAGGEDSAPGRSDSWPRRWRGTSAPGSSS